MLEALDSLGARADRRPRRSVRVLQAVDTQIGLAPGYAYQLLVDLAQPWTLALPLVDGVGNFGSRGNDPPANYRYTETRLSRAGEVALAAERGTLAPVPIGLINGNTHREGLRPPFAPDRVIKALRQVIRHPRVSDGELTEIIGAPDFLTGCAVTGDLAAMAAGQATDLVLYASVTAGEDGRQIIIENTPPYFSTDDVVSGIAQRARDHYGFQTRVPVLLPKPLPRMIRSWVRAFRDEDLLGSLATLEEAIAGQAVPSQ